MTDYDKFIKALEGFSYTSGENENYKWINFTFGNLFALYKFDKFGYLYSVKFERMGTLHSL